MWGRNGSHQMWGRNGSHQMWGRNGSDQMWERNGSKCVHADNESENGMFMRNQDLSIPLNNFLVEQNFAVLSIKRPTLDEV